MTKIFQSDERQITQTLNTPLTLKGKKAKEKYTEVHLSKTVENREKEKEYLKNGLKRKMHYP